MNHYTRNILSVSRLNQQVRELIEDGFTEAWIEGELSNLSQPASGHLYFTIKDQRCQVRCAMFRAANRNLAFSPQNGIQVLVHARVTLYPERGEFQLVVQHMLEGGEGELRRLLEVLRQRLEAEGLFAAEHKRPLPSFPRAIGVITSASGAAVRDVLSILKRRYPLAPVTVYATPVQGAAAGETIAAAIDAADRSGACDVLLLVRGGGSLEDLWSFNLEIVARAIFRCHTPLITGIGHEVDVTIADWVADCRGATPSAAAELAAPDQRVWQQRVFEFRKKLSQGMQATLMRAAQQLRYAQRRLVHPQRQLQNQSQRLDELGGRLLREMERHRARQQARLLQLNLRLARYHPQQYLAQGAARCAHLRRHLFLVQQQALGLLRLRLQNAHNTLEAVSPQRTLERGYAIASAPDERRGGQRIVDDVNRVAVNDIFQLRLANGTIRVQVLAVG